MPVVNRTRPRTSLPPIRTGNSGAATSSILSRGIPVGDITDDFVHLLLYGRNGIGKTTFACQFPKPLALVAVEPTVTGGAKSVKRIPGITYFRLDKSADVEGLAKELVSDSSFLSVVLDSGTSLDEIVLAEICGWDETINMNKWGKVSMDQYGERSERVRAVLRPYLDLKKNVVIIANEKDHNPPEGRKNAMVRSAQMESFFSAAMSGGTTRWLQDCCDYVSQLYMDKETVLRTRTVGKPGTPNFKSVQTEEETGKFVRRMRLRYHPNFSARCRGEDSDLVPEFIQGDRPLELYEKFMSVVNGQPIEEEVPAE